jgi:hypothetical protein
MHLLVHGHLAEQDNQSPFRCGFRYGVQRFRTRSSDGRRIGRSIQKIFQQVYQSPVMSGRRTRWGMRLQIVAKKAQPNGITLPTKQLHQGRRGINGKLDFVEIRTLWIHTRWIPHRRRHIQDELGTKIGLLFKPFQKQFLRSGEQFPIHVSGGLSWIVLAMLSEFHAESMKRAFVQASDETLNRGTRQKLQSTQPGNVVALQRYRHD